MSDEREIETLRRRVEQLEANQISLLRWIDMVSFQAVLVGDAVAALHSHPDQAASHIAIFRSIDERIAENITNLIENFDGKVSYMDRNDGSHDDH